MVLYDDFFKTTDNISRTYDILTEESIVWRENNMSYTGIILHKNAIIGFGDSKATKIINNEPQEDVERGKVNKVFAGKRYVIVTVGHNEFFDEDDGVTRLEQWLNSNIHRYDEPLPLLERYCEVISRTDGNVGREFGFIIGAADMLGLYARYCNVVPGRITIGNKSRFNMRQPTILTCGASYYSNDIETMNLRHAIKNLEVDELEGFLKEHIKGKIESVNENICYNPVGGPINVKIVKVPWGC